MTDLASAATIAAQWRATAEALEVVVARWAEVSADSIGPIATLLDHARRNAAWFQHEADGMSWSDARRAVEVEFGRQTSSFINYDPEDTEDNEDEDNE